ncbi:hypothetical protein H2248_004111 [Termitomyces sp. 'cryptogamus']|nr:hypothetical protein H2248_004111 [Termitomyces sp. 'cryptogamus']
MQLMVHQPSPSSTLESDPAKIRIAATDPHSSPSISISTTPISPSFATSCRIVKLGSNAGEDGVSVPPHAQIAHTIMISDA